MSHGFPIRCHTPFKHFQAFHGSSGCCGGGICSSIWSSPRTTYNINVNDGGFWGGFRRAFGGSMGSLFGGIVSGFVGNLLGGGSFWSTNPFSGFMQSLNGGFMPIGNSGGWGSGWGGSFWNANNNSTNTNNNTSNECKDKDGAKIKEFTEKVDKLRKSDDNDKKADAQKLYNEIKKAMKDQDNIHKDQDTTSYNHLLDLLKELGAVDEPDKKTTTPTQEKDKAQTPAPANTGSGNGDGSGNGNVDTDTPSVSGGGATGAPTATEGRTGSPISGAPGATATSQNDPNAPARATGSNPGGGDKVTDNDGNGDNKIKIGNTDKEIDLNSEPTQIISALENISLEELADVSPENAKKILDKLGIKNGGDLKYAKNSKVLKLLELAGNDFKVNVGYNSNKNCIKHYISGNISNVKVENGILSYDVQDKQQKYHVEQQAAPNSNDFKFTIIENNKTDEETYCNIGEKEAIYKFENKDKCLQRNDEPWVKVEKEKEKE